ncbi:OSJNBb0091E11.19-like protein [Zea mays]|uniref:OSJNBb0091E11.19-like protein n=1 Tax=Zea mays TaxID=4577 RepID=A0A1D6NLY7_MAIZE|nr:OSJNBb0091E11.19-like protein [Zea mays]
MLLVVPQGAHAVDPAAPGRGARRLLRHHVQRGADVRAGGAAAAERVGEPRVGRAADADHLRQQRLGLVRLGIQGEDGRGDAGHPQPGRGGGPGLRPAHRRRRHPCAVPARARQAGGGKQPAQERRVRGGPLLPARRVLGRARPAQHRGRPLAAPRLDDRLVQGRQVRGRRALRRAPGRARRRAGGRPGERARAGGPHRAWVDLPPRSSACARRSPRAASCSSCKRCFHVHYARTDRASDGVIRLVCVFWFGVCVRGIRVPCAPCGCGCSGVALGVFLL